MLICRENETLPSEIRRRWETAREEVDREVCLTTAKLNLVENPLTAASCQGHPFDGSCASGVPGGD